MHRIIKIFYIVVILMFGMLLTGCDKDEEAMFQEISEEELDDKGISGEVEEDYSETNYSEMNHSETIFVHVCGYVENPGVYELEDGSRIYEALEAAGGVTGEASGDSVNQAEVLYDGQQLYIPSKQEMEDQNIEAKVSSDGKININSASKEELMTLSGIGEAKADAIVRYRDECGGFRSIEEIMEIEGIKEGVFRKIKDQITAS